MSSYALIKLVHVSAVLSSLALFVLRGAWMIRSSPLLASRFARLVPHGVDTILLASAIVLSVRLGQYPFVDAWLTAKVLALIVYIVVGSLALKRAPSRRARLVCFVIALTTFVYIVSVARTHDPLPWS